jgi:hypothetical protein
MTAIHPRLENIFQAYLGDGRPLIRKRSSAVTTHTSHADMIRALLDLGDAQKIKRALIASDTGRTLRGSFRGMPLDELVAHCLEAGAAIKAARGRTDTTNTGKVDTIMMRAGPVRKAEALAAICKRFGPARLCKMLVDDNDSHGISEIELTRAITDSIELRDGETREQGFARVFCASDANGLALRKAMQIAKMTVYIGDAVATEIMDERNIPVRYSPRLMPKAETRSTWAPSRTAKRLVLTIRTTRWTSWTSSRLSAANRLARLTRRLSRKSSRRRPMPGSPAKSVSPAARRSTKRWELSD